MNAVLIGMYNTYVPYVCICIGENMLILNAPANTLTNYHVLQQKPSTPRSNWRQVSLLL